MDDVVMQLGRGGRKLDVEAVRMGIEKECPWRPGFFVRILPAATFNPRFRATVQDTALRRVQEQAGKKRSLVEVQDDAVQAVTDRYQDPEFVASALVASVRGVYDAAGNEVEMTPARILAVLADEGNSDVLQWVVGEAMQYGQYYVAAVARDAGNSSSGSSGRKAGAGRSRRTKSSGR